MNAKTEDRIVLSNNIVRAIEITIIVLFGLFSWMFLHVVAPAFVSFLYANTLALLVFAIIFYVIDFAVCTRFFRAVGLPTSFR